MYSIKSLIKRTLTYSKSCRLILIIALIFNVLNAICLLYAPYIIGHEIINLFVPGFVMESLVAPFIKLSLVVIVGFIFGLIAARLLNLATYRIVKDIRIAAFNKILTIPVSYLDAHLHGDILARLTSDIDQVWEGLVHGFTHVFRGIITILITIIFMFITKWQIALVVVTLTPLSLIVSYLISKNAHKSFVMKNNINGELVGLINEMISEQKTVIAYNLNEENNVKYQAINKRLYKVGVRSQFIASFVNPSTRLLNALVYASVAVYGTILIVLEPNVMNVGILSIFLFYASQYTRPFNEVSAVASELSNSLACLRRVYELLDEKDITDETNYPDIKIVNGEFDAKNISFSYDKIHPVLKNIDLSVFKNKKVALVGPTGCGKTTFINLLMRYYDVDSGHIALDEQNINDVNRVSLRNHVGMVLQDSWLFKGSVKDNIRYAKLEATDEEIIGAATLANAHDFIMKLPHGYDTIIDDDEGISLGQKQLICIARLMLLSPKILILDEATSNIDARTEIKVQKAFQTLMEGRTSLIIAHRLSTIKNADHIVVMKDGQIVEQGNHEQLIALDGFYKTLYYSK